MYALLCFMITGALAYLAGYYFGNKSGQKKGETKGYQIGLKQGNPFFKMSEELVKNFEQLSKYLSNIMRNPDE